MKTRYVDVIAYQTKDGSEIRELMHPGAPLSGRQSLAEAVVQPGQKTMLHRHRATEELYHVTLGEGRMTMGNEFFDIGSGDTVRIPPGTPHCVENSGRSPLHILCCCCPPYSHEDTELLGQAGSSDAAAAAL